MSLTLSNSANSSSRAGLTGSFRKLANSWMVMRPPLHELAMAAKPSSSFLKLSHFRLREQGDKEPYVSLLMSLPGDANSVRKSGVLT